MSGGTHRRSVLRFIKRNSFITAWVELEVDYNISEEREIIPEYIECDICERKIYPDRKPDPIWSTGIYTYQCLCGYKTHVDIGGDTAVMSSLTTTSSSITYMCGAGSHCLRNPSGCELDPNCEPIV